MSCGCAHPLGDSWSASVGSQRELHPWPAGIAPPGKCCLLVSRTHCLFVPPLVLWRCCSQLFSFVWLSIVSTQLMSKMCTVFFLQFSPLYCDIIICRQVIKKMQRAHIKLYVDIWRKKPFFQIPFIVWQLGMSVAGIEFCQVGLLVTFVNGLFFSSLVTSQVPFSPEWALLYFEKSPVTSKAPLNGETQFGQDDECGSDVVLWESVWKRNEAHSTSIWKLWWFVSRRNYLYWILFYISSYVPIQTAACLQHCLPFHN